MAPPSLLDAPGKSGRPASVDSLRINDALTDILPLLDTAESGEAFFPPFLEKVCRTTQGQASAVWLRSPRGLFERAFDHSWERAFPSEAAAAAHPFLLEDAAALARTTWQSLPGEGPTDSAASTPCLKQGQLAFLFAPILIGKKAIGLLEVVLTAPSDRELKRVITRLATELAGIAAAFCQKREWMQLHEERAFARDLDRFVMQAYQSLVPEEVAFVLANEGKKLIGCDQLSVAMRSGGGFKIGSVSAALALEPNSPAIRAMTALAQAVADWGELVGYEGARDESLPPDVLRSLDAYLSLSNPMYLVAMPLKGKLGDVVGVLLAESFERSPFTARCRGRLEAIAGHAASALSNAQTHDRLPLKWFTRPLADLRSHKGSSVTRWTFRLGILALVALVVMGIQLPRRMEATGQLAPSERRIVYSPRNGKVLDLAIHHGDRVEKGQELLFLEDHETQLKVDQLLVKMSSFDQKIGYLDEQLARNLLPKERTDLLAERIKANYEFNRAKVERDMLLGEVRNPRKAVVASPLSGRVVTFDPKEKLIGKTVKTGDPLLRIADVSGPWEIELYLPESSVGPIREALTTSKSLDVQILVTSDPHRSYSAVLTPEGLGGETTVRDDKVVLPARVTLTDRTLLSQLANMPVGVEVHARINCGYTPAGSVWFNEVWDFLYRRFVF